MDSHVINTWKTIQAWCLNPENKWYGMFGPKMLAPRWKSFDTFNADIGRRPSPAHVLKRFDDARPFEPGNYGWCAPRKTGATPAQQARSLNSRKLSDDEVLEVLALINTEGQHYSGVAVAFGVSPGYAWKVATGLTRRVEGYSYPSSTPRKPKKHAT